MLVHLIAAAALAAAAPPVPEATALDARLDAIAARFERMPITGMTIGLSRDGEPLLVRGYGQAEIATARPATADTVYEIGSITKMFTAAAILRLAEQGRIGLDDALPDHFPALAGRARGVTIRHLLNHRSGLFSGPVAADLTAPLDPAEVVNALATNAAEFAPGERFRYNNNGYFLLGLIIERLSGRTYGEHLEQEFFRPLGLASTGVCGTPRAPGVALGYRHPTRGPADPQPFERHHPGYSFAAGALCSTAGDLLRWQQALVDGRVLTPASFRLMTTPDTLSSGRIAPYGLGLFADEAAGEPHLHHGGASSGFITQLGYFPADRTGIVVLTNGIYSGAIVEQIEAAVLRAVRDQEESVPVRVTLSPEARDAYVGSYDLGPARLEVYAQGQDLRAQPPGQVAARLLHQGNGRFVAEHDPAIALQFRPDPEGNMQVVLSHNGRSMPPASRSAP